MDSSASFYSFFFFSFWSPGSRKVLEAKLVSQHGAWRNRPWERIIRGDNSWLATYFNVCVCVEGGPRAKSVWIIACGDILKMPAEIIHFFEVVFITLWLRRKAHGHSCGLAPPVSCLSGYWSPARRRSQGDSLLRLIAFWKTGEWTKTRKIC